MTKYRRSFTALAAVALAVSLFSVGFILPTSAQIVPVRPVIIAPGFEFNVFGSPANVPEFARSAFSGPVTITFDQRGRLFCSTYSGKILILLDNNDDGALDEVKTFASGISVPLGMAFRANGDLFVSSNVLRGEGRILRLRDLNGDDVADEITPVVVGLPSDGDHATNRLKFGPDGLLYFAQGSSTEDGHPEDGEPAERPLNGTMLKIDVDNPQISVVAVGLRNSFGLAFHPVNGELFAVDAGSGEVCQSGNCPPEDLSPPEEVNWIVQGANYGFPLCEGIPTPDRPGCAGVRTPELTYPQHVTPCGIEFYTGPQAGDFRNNLLVTLEKNLPNGLNVGGDLRRVTVEGNRTTGFQLQDRGFIAQFDPIDPFDGPLDVAIDPISGDIYAVRFDPVNHADPNVHHHAIYRIHRAGSDALPFIGPVRPAEIRAGSGSVPITIIGRHLRSGAAVFADGMQLFTRQLTSVNDLSADLPASLTTTQRTIEIQVRNPDGTFSNAQTVAITAGGPPPPPPPDKTPQIASFFLYKKVRTKVRESLFAGSKGPKYGVVVSGTDFDAGAQLLIGGVAADLVSSSATELEARFTSAMLATPGQVTVQVRNSTGRVSNTTRFTVVAGF